MTRGLKIVILIIGGLIAIAAIAYFVFLPFFKGSEKTPGANANLPSGALTNANAPAAPKNANNPPPPSSVDPEVEQISVARSVARTFAERLGTYTSDNGLTNLTDLKDISTSAVWKYIDGEYRRGIMKSLPASGYYSVVCTAMKTEVVPSGDNEVSARVSMQKAESGAVTGTSYITLNLKLKDIDGFWVVSWLEWE